MNIPILSWLGFFYFCIQTAYSQTKTMDKNNTYSVEIIRYNIALDQRSSFEEAYAKAGAILQKSSYCLGYEVIHGVDESQHYIVRIHWTSKQNHLNGFRNSPEFGTFFNLVKPFYNNIEEMKHYEITPMVWNRN